MVILLADKKDADKQLERELTGSTKTIAETLSDEVLSTKSQRKRKKKSYGVEFEEDSISGTEENSGTYPDCCKNQIYHIFFKL